MKHPSRKEGSKQPARYNACYYGKNKLEQRNTRKQASETRYQVRKVKRKSQGALK